MKYFSPIANINKITLYIVRLEMCFHYLIYDINPEHFHLKKSVLYVQKSIIYRVITLSKGEKT